MDLEIDLEIGFYRWININFDHIHNIDNNIDIGYSSNQTITQSSVSFCK